MNQAKQKAVDNYLVWELSKPVIRVLIMESNPTSEKIEQVVQHIRNFTEGNTLTFDEKLGLVKYFSPQSNRANLFRRCSWIEKDYLISDLGTVLPKTGDLPSDIITKSLHDVIEYVKKAEDTSLLSESIKYITDLAKIGNILKTIPIIIIEPGSLQRNEYVMNNTFGRGDWNIYPTLGYIEDGNHRAIAVVLANKDLKKIPSFVGKYPGL